MGRTRLPGVPNYAGIYVIPGDCQFCGHHSASQAKLRHHRRECTANPANKPKTENRLQSFIGNAGSGGHKDPSGAPFAPHGPELNETRGKTGD